MSSVLNLSRKWRSQNFDQIIGQDLAVRILKNSLYLGHYFPVYLFAGQRGCGKTSTARIFAAAVNCYSLSSFQKDPKRTSVPCLVCDSCIAVRNGNHPDFIEIDAASHTGVDNIRSIIESCSLLPVMGQKRVYLIDEAHMLSKAAFNAALKILEEPPTTALFILATTNPHKIIDTVKSRCFQLFFTSISSDPLKKYLQMICEHENIACTDEALDLIARHTDGSARDAINLLEQVRFSSSIVNKDAVLSLLGYIDDHYVMSLMQCIITGSSTVLVELLHSLHIDQHKAEFIWQRIIVLLRALLWIKHGVRPHELILSIKELEENAKLCTLSDLHHIMEALYNHEELFIKTTMQHIFLEMVLLDLCNKKRSNNDNNSVPCAAGILTHNNEEVTDIEMQDESDTTIQEVLTVEQKWQLFIASSGSFNDPLLASLFKQARLIENIHDMNHITIELSKDFTLFKEWLEKAEAIWKPVLHNIFSSQIIVEITFTGTQKSEIKKIKQEETVGVLSREIVSKRVMPAPAQSQEQFRSNKNRYPFKNNAIALNKNELLIDVSDETIWKKSALLMRHFPGTITEIRENK